MNAETAFVLRPMRMMELLDAAFRLYRRNFWTLVGIAAMIQVPISLLGLAPQWFMLESANSPDPLTLSYFLGLGLTIILGVLQFFLVSGVAAIAMTRCIISNYMGQKIGIAESFQQSVAVMRRFAGTLALAILMILGLYIWFLVPCAGWFSGLGMLLTVSAAIVPMAAPVITVEQTGVSETLSRTWDLVRRRFWWVLGLAGVLYLLNLVLAGPSLLVSVFFESFPSLSNTFDATTVALVGQTLVAMLLGILYLPLQISVFALAYFDLRVRTEGLDLFVNNVEAVTPEQVALMPRVKYETSTITGREFGYFIIISLGFALLYVALVAIVFAVFATAMSF
jgi:hypothetical protein